jgi:spore coat protein JA
MSAMPNPNAGAAGGVNPAFTAASMPNPNAGAAGGVNPAFTAASMPNYMPMPNLPVYPNPMLGAQQAALPNAGSNASANLMPMGKEQPIPLPTPIVEAAKHPYRYYEPFIGPYDPCPPIPVKRYVVPINQYLNFQPAGLPQFAPAEALKRGTLWPLLYSPYEPEFEPR